MARIVVRMEHGSSAEVSEPFADFAAAGRNGHTVLLRGGGVNGRRVVIIGIEVLAPGGPGIKEFWALLSEGRTATRKITFFDPAPFRSRVAAEIDFDPEAVGHSLWASGSLEIAASALAMRHNVVPPTANLHFPDPECDLDYVPLTARDHVTNTVLTVGSGFGGFQSAMVLASPDRSVP